MSGCKNRRACIAAVKSETRQLRLPETTLSALDVAIIASCRINVHIHGGAKLSYSDDMSSQMFLFYLMMVLIQEFAIARSAFVWKWPKSESAIWNFKIFSMGHNVKFDKCVVCTCTNRLVSFMTSSWWGQTISKNSWCNHGKLPNTARNNCQSSHSKLQPSCMRTHKLVIQNKNVEIHALVTFFPVRNQIECKQIFYTGEFLKMQIVRF